MKINVQLVKSTALEEFKELISVFENVFEMQNCRRPDDTHLQRLLNKDNFLVIIAKFENRTIAGLTVYVLDQYYSERPLAYIYDLAVLPEYQRKGVGRSLIEFTNMYCRQKGFEEIFVHADNVDDYAIDFYRSTKPTAEEQVVHFSYNLGNE